MASSAHALEVTPDTELTFLLSRNDDEHSRVTMTLHHPGHTDEYLAFKVSTHCYCEFNCFSLIWSLNSIACGRF
jgi:hypothetical protein